MYELRGKATNKKNTWRGVENLGSHVIYVILKSGLIIQVFVNLRPFNLSHKNKNDVPSVF